MSDEKHPMDDAARFPEPEELGGDVERLRQIGGDNGVAIARALDWLMDHSSLGVAIMVVPGPTTGTWSVVSAADNEEDAYMGGLLAHALRQFMGRLLADALEHEPPAGHG